MNSVQIGSAARAPVKSSSPSRSKPTHTPVTRSAHSRRTMHLWKSFVVPVCRRPAGRSPLPALPARCPRPSRPRGDASSRRRPREDRRPHRRAVSDDLVARRASHARDPDRIGADATARQHRVGRRDLQQVSSLAPSAIAGTSGSGSAIPISWARSMIAGRPTTRATERRPRSATPRGGAHRHVRRVVVAVVARRPALRPVVEQVKGRPGEVAGVMSLPARGP